MRLVSLLVALLFFIPPISSYALPDNYKKSIEKNLYIAKNRSSKYVWGASGDNNIDAKAVLNVDCSGFIAWLYRQSGIPVKRSQSLRMRMGLDGWLGKDITIDDADHLDNIHWTWKGQEKTRPSGHIGVLSEDPRTKLIEAVHASSSKGQIVSQQIRGQLLRDISSIRRITIGDKK